MFKLKKSWGVNDLFWGVNWGVLGATMLWGYIGWPEMGGSLGSINPLIFAWVHFAQTALSLLRLNFYNRNCVKNIGHQICSNTQQSKSFHSDDLTGKWLMYENKAKL